MTENEFWEITPRAFFNAIEGFESLRKVDLEVARLQTFRLAQQWSDGSLKDPKKLWSYPWEKIDPSVQKGLAYRAQKLAAKFDRIEKRHGNK